MCLGSAGVESSGEAAGTARREVRAAWKSVALEESFERRYLMREAMGALSCSAKGGLALLASFCSGYETDTQRTL